MAQQLLSVNQLYKENACPNQLFRDWYDILLNNWKGEKTDLDFKTWVNHKYENGIIKRGERLKFEDIIKYSDNNFNDEVKALNATGETSPTNKYLGINKPIWIASGLILAFAVGYSIYRRRQKQTD